MAGFDMSAMHFAPVVLFGPASLALWAGGLFVVVYLATRLAIRHERKLSN
jgi:hypothetical protein